MLAGQSLLGGAARTAARCLSTSTARRGGDSLQVHRDTPQNNADIPFEFTEENKKRAAALLAIYPEGHKRAAVSSDLCTHHLVHSPPADPAYAGPGPAAEWRLAAHLCHAPRGRGDRHAPDARVRGCHLLHHVYAEPSRQVPRSGIHFILSCTSTVSCHDEILQICTTTPCWLRGSDEILAAIKENLKVGVGGTTEDNLFTLSEVQIRHDDFHFH